MGVEEDCLLTPGQKSKSMRGFTLIELLMAMVVLAVILTLAVPSFTTQIQTGRAEMASQALLRSVANARATASQTGHRTILTVNGTAGSCVDAAWAVTQVTGTATQVLTCLTKNDFMSRYKGTSFSGDANTISYLPTGIATNSEVLYTFSAGSITKTVRINAGGTAHVL